jgi:putative ABC transport system substrate-binding protein
VKNLGRIPVIQELNPAKPAVENMKTAFSAFKEGKIVALLVTADPYFNSKRKEVIALANKLAVPAIYQWPSFVQAGGLMSYGPSKEEGYRNAGEMAGQILNGQLPKDLPVRETTAFELVISQRAAKREGIRIPTRVLDRPVRVL